MTTILHAMKNAATDVVEVSGLHFQVRKICSADLARVGMAALHMSEATQATNGQVADVPAEQLLNKVSPKQAAELAALQDATVAAGMVAVSDDGESWEPLRVVIDQKREDLDGGVLWVGTLAPGVVAACFGRIMDLSTDEDAAGERLARFRGRAEPASPLLDPSDQDRPLATSGSGA